MDHATGEHDKLQFEGQLYATDDTTPTNWLTAIRQAVIQILHCESVHCESVHIIKTISGTHVVSRHVLIAYVINKLIIVSVLRVSNS